MMFVCIFLVNLCVQLCELGVVIVDSVDLDMLGVDLQNNCVWINGKVVCVVVV